MNMSASKSKKSMETDELFTVVQFQEKGMKLFDCIPDCWFVDENRKSCFWPPKGKSYKLRALRKEKPDDTWEISKCVVVSGGYSKCHSSLLIFTKNCVYKFSQIN